MSTLKFIREFTEVTTAHGFGKINSSHGFRRALWCLITVGVFVAFSYHLAVLTEEYQSYTKSRSTQILRNHFTFPTVTFCQTNPFSQAKLTTFLSNNNTGRRILRFWQLAQQVDPRLSDNMFHLFQTSMRPIASDNDVFKHTQDHIVSCKYDTYECDFRNFTAYLHPSKFLCFAFTPNNRNLSQAGTQTGLKVVLNSYGTKEYRASDDDILDSLNGYEINIQAKNTRPAFARNRILADVGTLLTIGLEYKSHSNLNTKIERCAKPSQKQWIVTNFSANAKPYKHKYYKNNRDCYALKEQNVMLDKCGCLDETNPVESRLVPGGKRKIRFCHEIDNSILSILTDQVSGNITDLPKTISQKIKQMAKFASCHNSNKDNLRNEISKLKCGPDNCFGSAYNCKTQSTKWPSPKEIVYTQKILLKKMNKVIAIANGSGLTMDPSFLEYVSFNETELDAIGKESFPFVSVNIYATTLDTIKERESLNLPLSGFVAAVGGIIGLWIGFSIITLFEFTELILLVSYSLMFPVKVDEGESSQEATSDKVNHEDKV